MHPKPDLWVEHPLRWTLLKEVSSARVFQPLLVAWLSLSPKDTSSFFSVPSVGVPQTQGQSFRATYLGTSGQHQAWCLLCSFCFFNHHLFIVHKVRNQEEVLEAAEPDEAPGRRHPWRQGNRVKGVLVSLAGQPEVRSLPGHWRGQCPWGSVNHQPLRTKMTAPRLLKCDYGVLNPPVIWTVEIKGSSPVWVWKINLHVNNKHQSPTCINK